MTRMHRLAAVAVTMSMANPTLALGQAAATRAITVEVIGGGGATILDEKKWSGQTQLNDWSGGNYRYGGRVFFPVGQISVGAEVQHVYAYWYKLGSSYSYAERALEPTLVGGVARWSLRSQWRADLGAAAYVFDDFTDYGINGSIGYFVRLGEQWELPIQVRLDYIMDSTTPVIPMSVTIGLSHRLR
jgi:hypothetical protein